MGKTLILVAILFGGCATQQEAEQAYRVRFCKSVVGSPVCGNDKGVVSAYEDRDGHMNFLFNCDCKTGEVR